MTPLLPVRLHHPVLQPALVPEQPGRVLQPVAEVEQLPAVAAQLAGQPGGGGPLGVAPEDQYQGDGPPLGPRRAVPVKALKTRWQALRSRERGAVVRDGRPGCRVPRTGGRPTRRGGASGGAWRSKRPRPSVSETVGPIPLPRAPLVSAQPMKSAIVRV